jgi:hypothetical protein
MKRVVGLIALTLLLATGTAAVMTVHPHQAVACESGSCN